MRLWTHDPWRFPLPERHRFPIDKYALLRERVVADGTATAGEVLEAEAAPWPWLAAIQDPGLLERIRGGTLTLREARALGIPWSPELVERARRAVGGSVSAARFAVAHGFGMNLGGGTHHAGRAFARGYCLFNDVAVALRVLRSEGLASRALVVDCDVHQGDGTADLLAADPRAFTLSLHGARNYPFQRIPSDLDVDLPTGTGDDAYLAGADPWEGDRLGKLALTKAGLLRRDEFVLDRLRAAGANVCVVLAGGYAEDVRDTVEINAATAAAVAARCVVTPGL